MRILWHSAAPWAPTGYGTQTAIWTKYLKDQGHEVAISTYFGSPGRERIWNGMKVFPPPQDGVVTSLVMGHIQRFKPDVVIILADVWIMNPQIFKGIPTLAWVPADCSPLSIGDTNFFSKGDVKPVAMSEAGQKVLSAAGLASLWDGADIPCIPHGIDTEAFKPDANLRRAARAALNIEDDKFVIGMNFNNIDPVRKGVPEQFLAYSQFLRQHPKTVMVVHSMLEVTRSLHLGVLARTLRIGDDVIIADQYKMQAGLFGQDYMVAWYNMIDILSNCTYGEGFGLPAVEAQACGTPVILSDNTTGPQLKGPAGELAECEPYWNPVHQAWWGRPSPKSILKAYERSYKGWHTPTRRTGPRNFALSYDFREIGPMWTELLEAL